MIPKIPQELWAKFTAKKPVPEAISMQLIYDLGRDLEIPFYRAIYYFIYLTGARVTEALNVNKEDLQYEEIDLTPAVVVKIKTLKKKRGNRLRLIPIKIGDRHPIERDMWGIVKNYIDKTEIGPIFPMQKYTARHLVHYYFSTRIKILVPAIHGQEFLTQYELKMRPHYLRHCRLTHLVQEYGMDSLRLMNYAGWSNTNPAMFYIQFNWRDIAKSMEKG